jgi:prepilin-type N-terminal cleavage/methylation domain-containing protein
MGAVMNKFMNKAHILSSAKGFTLLEVAMAVIIGGMLLGLFGEQLIHTLRESKIKTTQYRLEEVHKAVNRYMIYNNHLPCPANRQMEMNNALYGYAIGTSSSVRGGGTCRSGTSGTASAGGVHIGMVPTRNLNLPDEFGYDGWGSRLIYAVTEQMTNGTTFGRIDAACGAAGGPCIQILGHGQPAAFVIASVGPDRLGGYNIYGQSIPCAMTPGRADSENCDDDATFTDMPHSSAIDSGHTNHNDDMILYSSGEVDSDGVPTGAIMPFRLNDCPKGWDKMKELEGRILVDSGAFSASTAPQGWAAPNLSLKGIGGTPTRFGAASPPAAASATEYDNFPPYIAYTYCVKS